MYDKTKKTELSQRVVRKATCSAVTLFFHSHYGTKFNYKLINNKKQ